MEKQVRRPSDMTNLQKAAEIRNSGYQTKVHASKHKEQIDKWLIRYRWSSRVIVNELKKLDPTGDHPSRETIDHYREKYLSGVEAIRVDKKYADMYANLMNEFDTFSGAHNMLMQLYGGFNYLMDEGFEAKLKIPSGQITDRLKVLQDLFRMVFDMEVQLGLRKKEPETNINFNLDVKNGELPKSTTDIKARISALKQRIESLREESGKFNDTGENPAGNGRSRSGVETVAGTGDNQLGAGGPEQIHDGHAGLPEQLAPSGVVSDTGKQTDTGQENGQVKTPDQPAGN